MITNSHFIPLYENHNTSFATLGVHGDALFFFVSGFFLTKIETSPGKYIRFDNWIKKKIARLWPTIIVFFIFASLIFSKEISWYDFLFGGYYWFVRCFIISFSIIYFVIRYLKNYVNHTLVLSILISSVYVIFAPKTSQSIFHTFHYVMFFSSMMLGVIIGLNKDKIKTNNLLMDLILCGSSFIAYFLIMYLGKGKTGIIYYTQLFAVFPLLFFLFYLYKTVSYKWVDKLASYKIWSVIFIISSLTYEIYIVQFDLITDAFNNFYPFNTIMVFCVIIAFAYSLRVLTNFFLQLFSSDPLDLTQVISI